MKKHCRKTIDIGGIHLYYEDLAESDNNSLWFSIPVMENSTSQK